ncbi:MAG: hypothetical protein WAN86_14840 [Hyphomicrobiaceae bacterium]
MVEDPPAVAYPQVKAKDPMCMHPLSLLLGGLLATALAAGGQAASPDDPGAPVKANRYSPVTSGTKSYRPVQPLPWGDVNRRVAPKQTPKDKQGAPTQPQPKR